MFVPMLYTFLIVNVDDSENMDFYFDSILIGQLLVFLNHFGSILDMQHIMSISFENSYSPYESTTADYWCMLFFYYYMLMNISKHKALRKSQVYKKPYN